MNEFCENGDPFLSEMWTLTISTGTPPSILPCATISQIQGGHWGFNKYRPQKITKYRPQNIAVHRMDNPMHGDKISPCIGSTISKKFFVFIWDGLERVREALPEGDPPLQNISKIIQFLFWESLSNLINQS